MSIRLAAAAASAALGLALLPAATNASASSAPASPPIRAVALGTTTGALPACAGDYHPPPDADYSGFEGAVSRESSAFKGEYATAMSQADCLYQNVRKVATEQSWIRGVNGSFVPSEVGASTTSAVMSLRITPVGVDSVGRFFNWGCAPQTQPFTGGCSATWRPDIVWRPANAAGRFDGIWFTASNNPWFAIDYSRCGGGPASGQSSTLPCQVTVRFAKDTAGKVLLQKDLQVVVMISTDATKVYPGYPTRESLEVPVSFVIRAGGGLAVTAASTPRSVRYGGSALVTARVDGVAAGSAVVAEAGPTTGRGPWRVVGRTATDAKGLVRFTVKPTATARYRVRLLSAPVGATVADDAGVVSVVSTVAVAAGRVAAGKVPLTVTVHPGAVRATVQRLVGKRWVAVAFVVAPKSGVGRVSVALPKGRSTLRVVVPARTGLLGTVSRTVSVIRP